MVDRGVEVLFFVMGDEDILSVTIQVRFSGHGEDALPRLRKVSFRAFFPQQQ